MLREIIARMGKWYNCAMDKSYLPSYPRQGLLAAGGWPAAMGRKDQYFHARFKVEVPPSLLVKMLPSYFDLETELKEV